MIDPLMHERVCVQMPNVLGLLFGLAQMGLYFVYRNRNPKKNGAVSEMQQQQQAAAAVQADDAEKEQQLRQAHADADVEAVAVRADDEEPKNVVVDIMLPVERAPPMPLLLPPAMPLMTPHQTAVEVV